MSDQDEVVSLDQPEQQYDNPTIAQAAVYQPGLIYPPGYPLSTGMNEADRRKLYLQQCVTILKQALAIRKDEGLMAEIRAMIRAEQDDIMVLLDDLG